MDQIYHGPNWTKRERFEAGLEAFTSAPAWVTEWQFPEARDLLLERADTFLWLDLPFRVVLWRVTLRTLRRWVRQEALWAGNREQPPWKILWDRSNMIRWSIVSRRHVAEALPGIRKSHPHLRIRRLRSPAAVERVLQQVRSAEDLV